MLCVSVVLGQNSQLPNTKLGQDLCDDSGGGVRTHSYDCSPHTKYVKRIVNVYSGSGMSMKWMRGPYHYISV